MRDSERECKHNWQYTSPPHREQKCKKCGERRIENDDPKSLEYLIGNSKISDLAWRYCELNDAENGDYVKELSDSIRSYLLARLPEEKETTGAMNAYVAMQEGYNYCLKDVKERILK